MQKAVIIYLLCQIANKPPCTNLIPTGAVYNGITYVITSLLTEYTHYQVIFGSNDISLNNPGGEPTELDAPGTFTFTTAGSFSDDVELVGDDVNVPVTAIICLVTT